MLPAHVVSQALSIGTEGVTSLTGKALGYHMLALYMHFDIGFNIGTIATLRAGPGSIQLFSQQRTDLLVQIWTGRLQVSLVVPGSVQVERVFGWTDFVTQFTDMARTVHMLGLYVELQPLAGLVGVGTVQALEQAAV